MGCRYVWIFVSTLILSVSMVSADEALRVGVAESDITPPLGYPMAGYYHERLATGIHDPLKCKAIVWRSGEVSAALAVCDLTGIATDLTAEVRRRVSEATGIPANHIVLSATHSHTAPDYSKNVYVHLAKSTPQQTDKVSPYAEQLIKAVTETIQRAHETAQPAQVECANVTQQTPISFNRRFVTKDGSVRTWLRLDHPDVLRAAGPIDPQLSVAAFRVADGNRLSGVLSNFALHLDTVGGTLWSADYPFYLERAVREKLGAEVISIFGLGCCGDINHIDPVAKERNKTDFIGMELGKTLETALTQLKPIEAPSLRVLHTRVELPLQDVSDEQIARAEAILPSAKAGKQTEFFELVTAYKSLMLAHMRGAPGAERVAEHLSWGLSHHLKNLGPTMPVEVNVIALGKELAIVCLPGEVFVEHGLAIKNASPFATTMVIELSNCVETVYIPTRVAYAGGSYEVTNSTTQPGSGEMLVEAAVRLLREAAGG